MLVAHIAQCTKHDSNEASQLRWNDHTHGPGDDCLNLLENCGSSADGYATGQSPAIDQLLCTSDISTFRATPVLPFKRRGSSSGSDVAASDRSERRGESRDLLIESLAAVKPEAEGVDPGQDYETGGVRMQSPYRENQSNEGRKREERPKVELPSEFLPRR